MVSRETIKCSMLWFPHLKNAGKTVHISEVLRAVNGNACKDHNISYLTQNDHSVKLVIVIPCIPAPTGCVSKFRFGLVFPFFLLCFSLYE